METKENLFSTLFLFCFPFVFREFYTANTPVFQQSLHLTTALIASYWWWMICAVYRSSSLDNTCESIRVRLIYVGETTNTSTTLHASPFPNSRRRVRCHDANKMISRYMCVASAIFCPPLLRCVCLLYSIFKPNQTNTEKAVAKIVQYYL